MGKFENAYMSLIISAENYLNTFEKVSEHEHIDYVLREYAKFIVQSQQAYQNEEPV